MSTDPGHEKAPEVVRTPAGAKKLEPSANAAARSMAKNDLPRDVSMVRSFATAARGRRFYAGRAFF